MSKDLLTEHLRYFDDQWTESQQYKFEFADSPTKLIAEWSAFRCLTLLTRIPAGIGIRLQAVQEEMEKLSPAQYFYPVNDFHFTILDCSWVTDDRTTLVERSGLVAETCRSILRDVRAFSFEVTGLNLFPVSVFAQVLPHAFGLRQLRSGLAQSLEKVFGRTRSEEPIDRIDAGYSNVVRFLTEDAELLRSVVSMHRATCFGNALADSIELVITDKLFSQRNTQVIERFALPLVPKSP